MSTPPTALKVIHPYVLLSNQYESRDLVVAYYSLIYAVEQGVKLVVSGDGASKCYLLQLMDQLERMKAKMKGREALHNENIAWTHIQEVAFQLLEYADNEDRQARFHTNMTEAFSTTSSMLSILKQFGELSDEMMSKMTYAKWRAVEINRCLKNGIVPISAFPGGDEKGNAAGLDAENTCLGQQVEVNLLRETLSDAVREMAPVTGDPELIALQEKVVSFLSNTASEFDDRAIQQLKENMHLLKVCVQRKRSDQQHKTFSHDQVMEKLQLEVEQSHVKSSEISRLTASLESANQEKETKKKDLEDMEKLFLAMREKMSVLESDVQSKEVEISNLRSILHRQDRGTPQMEGPSNSKESHNSFKTRDRKTVGLQTSLGAEDTQLIATPNMDKEQCSDVVQAKHLAKTEYSFSTQDQGTYCHQEDFMNKVAAKIPAAWLHFGISLGINIGKLEAVEQSYPNNPLRCFIKVYSIWEQERVRPLTWEVVVEILKSDVMAQKVLSSELATEYNLQ